MADLVGRAVSDFLRTLRTRKDSAYDRFIELNRLESRPESGDSSQTFAQRLLSRIAALESTGALRLPKDFSADALYGLKAFFRTEGTGAVGNCVACHTPPLFTDSSFHNVGISQREYDLLHGEGKFASLSIPGAGSAFRPSIQFREMPSKENPRVADLGFWNFVDLKSSLLRRRQESDEAFLQRMIGTFKTPALRNLKYTQPYFHDGSVHTLEEVVAQMIRLSEMAPAGRIREADDELSRIRLSTSDIAPIAAFLTALNEDLKRGH
jgi:cytochrome c peroxidase